MNCALLVFKETSFATNRVAILAMTGECGLLRAFLKSPLNDGDFLDSGESNQ